MPLFGIGRAEAQKLIDYAVNLEASERRTEDTTLRNTIYGHIDAVEAELLDTINKLTRRIEALEGTEPPPPPTAELQANAVIDPTDVYVVLTGTSNQPSVTWRYACDSPGVVQLDDPTRWRAPRAELDYEAIFTLTVGPTGSLFTAMAVVLIPAKQTSPAPVYELNIPAAKFKLRSPVSMQLVNGDHIAVWGQPGEIIEAPFKLTTNATVQVWLDYVLARESADTESGRAVDDATVVLPPTCDLWSSPVRAWSEPVSVPMLASYDGIEIENPTVVPWSNFCDLYSVKVKSPVPFVLDAVHPTARSGLRGPQR